jgi:hypothetical protein
MYIADGYTLPFKAECNGIVISGKFRPADAVAEGEYLTALWQSMGGYTEGLKAGDRVECNEDVIRRGMIKLLASCIKEWDLLDGKRPVPIVAEEINKLEFGDLKKLCGVIFYDDKVRKEADLKN